MTYQKNEKKDLEQLYEELMKVYNKMLSETIPLDPEFEKVLYDNFWDLI